MKERVLIAGSLFFLGIVCIYFGRPEDDNYKLTEYKRFWIEKTHNPSTYNVLVCGDSRVYRGVSCAAIESKLPFGYDAFNFGYSSGSYSKFMLDKIETKIDRAAPDRIIVLGITPYSLTPKAAEDSHIREELARKKEEIFEYLYLAPIKRVFEPFTVQQLSDLYGLVESGSPAVPLYYQEYYPSEGWVASWKTPADSTKALAEYQRDFRENKVDNALINDLMIRASSWTKQGIRVFAFRLPTTQAMEQLEDSISGFQEPEFVKEFQKAGGRWIEIASAGYVSYDGSHLTKESAERLSEKIGREVNPLPN